MGVVLYIAYSSAQEAIYPILNLSNVGTERLFFIVIELARSIGIKISIFLIVVGLADYMYQRYEHTNKLKMTKQEIKDEYKEMEGDPQVKSERKQRYQEMLSGNIKDVEDATVIITNPTHLAIAVRYNREENQDEVPIVLVKGADHMAQKIRERANEANIPMIDNKPVARALYKTADAGDPIPMDLYQAVAEILALIFQLEESKKHKI
jgi:flagellar biosynthetic protein FlhB/flagellar biosynthetic protein FliR/FlhB